MAANDAEMISLTHAEAQNLKWHYNRAVEEGKLLFMFKGREFVTSYAKYMLQYLEMEFGEELEPLPPAGLN